ncbi:MAG: DNA-binding CsgD family transcriptional regulator [Paracoccaceae bacterium]|jgi:DNA-binding CsgD family transcriptional regulator
MNIPERPINAESQCLGNAIAAVGSTHFPECLAELIHQNSPYDRLFISSLYPHGPPEFLSSNLPEHPDVASMESYLTASFLLDPFYQMYLDGVDAGVFRLGDCVPHDFFVGDYFLHFCQKFRLMDECAILVPSADGSCIFLSTGYCDPSRLPQGGDTDGLVAIYPVIKALCQQHWPALSRGDGETTGQIRAHLNTAFQNFGSTVLTPREREVVHLILRGHSGKSLSQKLGISLQTVKNHRKSIHAKLDITTQGELFSIFLSAVTESPVGSMNDPLEHYLRAS